MSLRFGTTILILLLTVCVIIYSLLVPDGNTTAFSAWFGRRNPDDDNKYFLTPVDPGLEEVPIPTLKGSMIEERLADIELERHYSGEPQSTAEQLVLDGMDEEEAQAPTPPPTAAPPPSLDSTTEHLLRAAFSVADRPSCDISSSSSSSSSNSSNAVELNNETIANIEAFARRTFLLIIPRALLSRRVYQWMAATFCRYRLLGGDELASPSGAATGTMTVELHPAPVHSLALWVRRLAAMMLQSTESPSPSSSSSSSLSTATTWQLRYRALKFLSEQISLVERTAILRKDEVKPLVGFAPDPDAGDFSAAVARARRNNKRRADLGFDRAEKPYRIEENRPFIALGGRSGIKTRPQRGCCGAFGSPKLFEIFKNNSASSSLSSVAQDEILFAVVDGVVAAEHFALLAPDVTISEEAQSRRSRLHRVGPKEMRWVADEVVNINVSVPRLRPVLRRPLLGVGPKSSFSSFHRASALRFSKKHLCPPSARVAIHVPLFWPRCVYTSDSVTKFTAPRAAASPPPPPGDRSYFSIPKPQVRGLSCPRLDIFLQQIDGFNTIRYEVDLYIHVHRERLQFLPRQYKGEILRRFNRGAVYFVDHHWGEHPWFLAWKPRTLMRNSVGLYDLFFYTEDDIGVTGKTFDYFCDNHFRVQRLSLRPILGLFRFERYNGSIYPTDRDAVYRHDVAWTAVKNVKNQDLVNMMHLNPDIRDDMVAQGQRPVPFHFIRGGVYMPFWWATGSDVKLAADKHSGRWIGELKAPSCNITDFMAEEEHDVLEAAGLLPPSPTTSTTTSTTTTTTTTTTDAPTTTTTQPDTVVEIIIGAGVGIDRIMDAEEVDREGRERRQQLLRERERFLENYERKNNRGRRMKCFAEQVLMTREHAAWFNAPRQLLFGDEAASIFPMDEGTGCVEPGALVEHIGLHSYVFWGDNVSTPKAKLLDGACVPLSHLTPAPSTLAPTLASVPAGPRHPDSRMADDAEFICADKVIGCCEFYRLPLPPQWPKRNPVFGNEDLGRDVNWAIKLVEVGFAVLGYTLLVVMIVLYWARVLVVDMDEPFWRKWWREDQVAENEQQLTK